MKPAKPFSATMDEQTFVPPTMRALYYSMPAAAGNKANSSKQGEEHRTLIFDSDFPTPRQSPSQYLIKVLTAAFSHDEVHLARSLNPTQCMPQIPLHNICGTVISTPSQDHWSTEGPKFKVDDVVFGLVSYARDGGAADYILATEDELAFKPKNISATEAVAIPLPALSAWRALFTYGGLEPGGDDNSPPVHGNNHRRNTSRISSTNSTNGTTSSQSSLSKTSRILITNAGGSETALQALHLLRSPSLFPCNNGNNDSQPPKPWICVTCTSAKQAALIRTQEASINEIITVPFPLAADFDLAAIFRDNHWEPVDIVLDCAGGQVLRQTYSPYIVRDYGTVLTAVDHGLAHYPDKGNGMDRGLVRRFVAVEPDGETLGRIAGLVEDGSVRGRAARVVDLVHGQDVLGGDGGDAVKGGEMIVVRVNAYS